LGGRPAESFAKRLLLPLRRDTLLRLVRRRGAPLFGPPRAVGIDGWAWKRNYRYGTLICDLERRRTISLLPDRELSTAQAWFAAQPQIKVVTRDRGGADALPAARALPGALQVADRWHLMENASQAFLAATRSCIRAIRAALGAPKIDPRLLTSAEKLQYEGYLRREEINAAILELAKARTPIKEIVRRTGHSRGLVRKVLRGQHSEVFQTRESSLDRFLPWLDVQWEAGARNGAALHRALKSQGFGGSLRVVTEWATRRRRAETANLNRLSRTPSARTIARLLTVERNQLSRAQSVTVDRGCCAGVDRSTRADGCLPRSDPTEEGPGSGRVAQLRERKPDQRLRPRPRQRPARRARRHLNGVVKRSGVSGVPRAPFTEGAARG
jgi:transposase